MYLHKYIYIYIYIYIHRMIHDYTRLSYESQSPDIQRALFTDHPIATLDDHPVRSSRWNLRRGTRGKAA